MPAAHAAITEDSASRSASAGASGSSSTTNTGLFTASFGTGNPAVSQTSNIDLPDAFVSFSGSASDSTSGSSPDSSLFFFFTLDTPTAYTFDVTTFNTSNGGGGAASLATAPGGVATTNIENFVAPGEHTGTLPAGEYRLYGDASVQGSGSANVSYTFQVPEPSSMACVAGAVGMLLAHRRRRV